MSKSLFVHLDCPECSEVRTTARALYYHLRYDHKLEHSDAFVAVGNSISDSETVWGQSENTDNSRQDLFNNRNLYKSNFPKKPFFNASKGR